MKLTLAERINILVNDEVKRLTSLFVQEAINNWDESQESGEFAVFVNAYVKAKWFDFVRKN